MSATVFICTSCRQSNGESEEAGQIQPGFALAAALEARFAAVPGNLQVERVECLAVCGRPCTVALAEPGKWTYLIGDLTEATQLDDIVAGACAYAASENGLIPWKERPICFRKGVIARVPPLPHIKAAPSDKIPAMTV